MLLEIIQNVDFFCDAHKHLKGRQRAIAASTNKDDPPSASTAIRPSTIYCDNDDCIKKAVGRKCVRA